MLRLYKGPFTDIILVRGFSGSMGDLVDLGNDFTQSAGL